MLGISRDKLRSQQKFADKQELSYPMLADPTGETIRAFGVKNAVGLAKRVTFLIDAGGSISKVYDNVSVKTHAADILEQLGAG